MNISALWAELVSDKKCLKLKKNVCVFQAVAACDRRSLIEHKSNILQCAAYTNALC